MAFARKHAFQSGLADGGDSSLVQPSNWNAAFVVSDATVGGIPYCPTATTETTSSGLTYAAATGQGLIVDAGTATTDVAVVSCTGAFNNAGVTFSGAYQWGLTDTAKGSASLHSKWSSTNGGTLLTLRHDGVLKFGPNLTYTADISQIYPNTDNAKNLGVDGSLRWLDLYMSGILSLSKAGVAVVATNATTTTGANVGTLTNCPHTGNPALYWEVSINGTVYAIPCFALT